jgi:HEAT repeat protein
LSLVIARSREVIKKTQEPIPAAKNPAVAPLMGSLQAIPPEAQEARIAIIEALGKTREPVALRALLLVSGARGKQVRKAVAIALAGIRHSLSAYILLPMLEDNSSRVRNVAIQALIAIEQPHCMEAIFAACCQRDSLHKITCDALQRLNAFQRVRFANKLSQLPFPASDAEKTVRRTLLECCQSEDQEMEPSSQSDSHDASRRPEGSPDDREVNAAGSLRTNGDFSSGTRHENPSRLNPGAHASISRQLIGSDVRAESNFFGPADVEPQVDLPEGRVASRRAEDPGDLLPARSNQRGFLESEVPARPQTTTSGPEVADFVASSDSFADLSLFESVTSDRGSSSYSAHLLPTPSFPNSSGSHSHSSSTYTTAPWSHEAVNAQVGLPTNPMSAHGAGWTSTGSSLSGLSSGGASSIIRRAPELSGVHGPQGVLPRHSWSGSAAVPDQSLHGMTMPSSFPMASAMPSYPLSPFVPAFAASSMPSGPQMFPAAPMGMQTLQPGGFNAATGGMQHGNVTYGHTTTNDVASPDAHHTMPEAGQETVTHSVTVHLSEVSTTTTTTSETATPEATAAEIVRISQEQNLQRLREMRDSVFKALLKTQTAITGQAPRLVTRKISALLTTPVTDLPAIRKQLIALGETQSPHVIETISSFSQKPSKEIRMACAESLGFIPSPTSAIQLLKFLSDKSGTVTEAAVRSLGHLDLAELHPVLLAGGLINSSLRTVVMAAAEGAGDAQKSKWEQSLLGFTDSADGDLAAFAITMLARITGATHCELYEKTICSRNAGVRAASVDALIRTGKKRAIGLINEALVDPDAAVRRNAVAALSTLCSPRSVELLSQLLQDEDLSVRRTAAVTAGKIDEPDLGPGIVRALEHEFDPAVVESLLEALQRNAGAEGHSVLTRYVEGEAKEYRESALKALRKLKSQESIPVFRRLLDDSSASIRKQCVEQLAVMKVTGALARIRDMLRSDSDENLRAACAKAVGDFQDHSSLAPLEAALEDHPTVRFQAIIALGKIGSTSAGPSLVTLLNDPQPEIRYQAVKALGQLKLPGCEERVEMLLQDSDEMVRRGAEQTLLALGVSTRQISIRKFRRRLAKVASVITPSQLLGAVPGRGGSIVTVVGLMIAICGYWYLPHLSSLISGSSSLPVFRVQDVRVSALADLAVVWRKEFVFDIAKASTGELQARIQAPSASREVMIEGKGGVIVQTDKAILRLGKENAFDPLKAKSKELSEVPLALYLHPKDNLCCLFMPTGSGTRLELLDAETLEAKGSHEIKAKFGNRCIVSPDRKMALSIAAKGQLAIAELATGEVFRLDLQSLVKGKSIGNVLAVQFTQDMKYVCFCTSTGLYVFSVEKMRLEKQIDQDGGFFAVTSSEDGRIRAVSSKGKIVELAADLDSVTEKKLEGSFDLVSIDAKGNIIIFADSDSRVAEVFDIERNKLIAKILGE